MAFAQVFGKILGAVGGIAQTRAGYMDTLGRAGKMKFDASLAERNAEMARQDQVLAKEAGEVERANITKEENVARGEGKTAYAAGNVQVDTGTPLEFDIAVAEQSAAERERSKDDQAVKISRLKTEEQGLLAESRLLRRAARKTRKSGQLGAVGGVFQAVGGAMS